MLQIIIIQLWLILLVVNSLHKPEKTGAIIGWALVYIVSGLGLAMQLVDIYAQLKGIK